MAAKTYDPKKVSIIFGVVQLSGFSENSKVKVSQRENAFNLTVGVDGEGMRVKSNDSSATIEIELLQTSLSNNYLDTIANLDKAGNAGALPLIVREADGATVLMCETAWVMKKPDVEFGSDSTPRVWVLETDSMQSFIGGL